MIVVKNFRINYLHFYKNGIVLFPICFNLKDFLYLYRIMAEEQLQEIIPEIEHYYPLEKIALIASKLNGYTIDLINNFRELYDSLDIKFPEINNFRRNSKFMNKNGKSNVWKRKNRFKRKEIEKFLTNSYIKQLPDNNIEKIKRVIITNLNKLNEKKFTIIVKEFIDQLEELMYFESYEILNNEILNKIHMDTYFISLYAKLVKELIINKKWQKKMFNILDNKDGQYYWSLNRLEQKQKEEEEYYGPFDSVEEALDDAFETNNYKLSFCKFIENKFKDRHIYKNEIIKSEDNFELNIFSKNRYNNLLKFLYSTYDVGIFNHKIIHHVLIELLNTYEIEQFIYIFDILNKSLHKLDKINIKFYEDKIIENLSNLIITAKTRFKLQEYFKLDIKNSNTFDILASLSSNENTNDYYPKNDERYRNIDCIISEYPINQDYDNAKQIFVKIINYDIFYSKIIQEILDANDSKRVYLFELLNKLWDDFGKFGEEFEVFIIKKMAKDYSNLEIDYPYCSKIFLDLITIWIKKNYADNQFINKLKNNNSEDEDEKYSIEIFNEKITNQMKMKI